MSHLSLFLLGLPRIETATETPITFRSRKEMALLAYLAVEHCHAHSRTALAGLFWPESGEVEARRNLRVTLSRLRKAIAADKPNNPPLLTTRTTIQFNADSQSWSDVAAYAELLTAADGHDHAGVITCSASLHRLERAVTLYRGDFLAGFYLEGCPEFEEWQLMQRERYRGGVLDALQRLASASSAAGDYCATHRHALRQLELDPLREHAYRQAMEALVHLQQYNEALVYFKRCRRILREELSVEPAAETTALADWVREQRLRHAPTDQADKGAPASASTERREPHAPLTNAAAEASGEPKAEPESNAIARPHNLHQHLTPFIGRETELALLHERLASRAYRAINIVGPGGIGKSRLALHAAAQQLHHFADGVYFVALAQIQDRADVPAAIADALATPLIGNTQPPEQQLIDRLRQRETLLILDNLEHLLGVTRLLLRILQEAPNVVLLITSRERLNVQAEDLITLHGLPVPPNTEPGAIEPGDALHYAAVRLFVDRARRLRKSFQLNAENVTDVVQICQLVEGMPLGIELAVSLLDEFDCAEIGTEITRGLDILSTSLRDLPMHHRSIRSVFESSWSLLLDAERVVLAQLSIFRGGFTRDAARLVTGASPRLLTQLRHKSLLRNTGTRRFDMHELLRQFAAEKLISLGAQQEHALKSAHGHYYLGLVAAQTVTLYSANARAAAQLIQKDLDNVRRAWAWAVLESEWTLLEESHVGLLHFYELTGLLQEGQALFQQAVTSLQQRGKPQRGGVAAQCTVDLLIATAHLWSRLKRQQECNALLADASRLAVNDEQRASILILRGRISGMIGRYADAIDLLQQGVALAQRTQRPDLVAHGQADLGFTYMQTSQIRAAELHLQQARETYQRTDNQLRLSEVFYYLGTLAGEQNELARALHYIQEQQQIVQQIGDRKGEATTAHALSNLYNLLGLYAEAIAAAQHAQRICQQMGEGEYESFVLHMLCDSHRAVGQLAEAERCGERAVRLAETYDSPVGMAFARHYLATVHADYGALAVASEHYTRASAHFKQIGKEQTRLEPLAALAHVRLRQGKLTAALQLVEEILLQLDGKPVTGVDHPLHVYWHCYTVLCADNDPRATAVLYAGYTQLQEMASKLTDQTIRRSFLENVAAHRAIVTACQRLPTVQPLSRIDEFADRA